MHGAAPGSGAPRGNKNALKHGLYTRQALDERQQIGDARKLARDIEGSG
jgi:uncharacterized protein YjcR